MSYALYYSALDFLGRAFRLVFGFMVVLLLVMLFLMTALDIMYLTIPLVQSGLDKYLDGGRMGGFRLLSKDAVLAKEECNETGTHLLFCYLKKRLFTYIVAAIILYMLIVGPGDLIMYIWSVVKNVFTTVGLLK